MFSSFRIPKKNIVFMTDADECYVGNDTGEYNVATQECLSQNKAQIIKVAIITGRNATGLSSALKHAVDKNLSGADWEQWKQNGLDAIEKDILSKLKRKRKIDICIPNDLIEDRVVNGTNVSRKPGTSYDKFRSHEVYSLNGASPQEALDRLNEAGRSFTSDDGIFGNMQMAKIEGGSLTFGGKGDQVKFYLNSLVGYKERSVAKIYMDDRADNVVEVFEKNRDVISVLNNIEMGCKYNKHALDLAIKAANSNSEEEILEIKKTLLKAALEYEQCSIRYTNLKSENIVNSKTSIEDFVRWHLDDDCDWFKAVRKCLEKDQENTVKERLFKLGFPREPNLLAGEPLLMSPESPASPGVVKMFGIADGDGSLVSLNPFSPRLGVVDDIGSMRWEDSEAGVLPSSPRADKHNPKQETKETLAYTTQNRIGVLKATGSKNPLAGILEHPTPIKLFSELFSEAPLPAMVNPDLQGAAGVRSEHDLDASRDSSTVDLTPTTPPRARVGGSSSKAPRNKFFVNPGLQGAAGKTSSLDDSFRSAIPPTPAPAPAPIKESISSRSRPQSSSNFSATYENNIIKFQIRSSGAEKSTDASNKSSDPDKFNYNKEPSEEEKSLLDAFNPTDSCKYLSSNYTEEKEQGDILKLLQKASVETIKVFGGAKLDDNFFIAVMKVASEKCGIASIKSEEEFNRVLTSLVPTLETSKYTLQDGDTLYKIAKYFSAQFQSSSEDDKYFTAREGAKGEFNNTGRRLFRVCNEENIKAFQEKQKELAIISPPQPQKLEAVSASSPSTSPRRVEKPKGSSTSPDLVYARVYARL